MTDYRWLSRSQWGGTFDGTPLTEQLNDPEVYIHHVGGAAWMSDDAVRVFNDLNNYAKGTKGYQFLDYDLLVHYSRSADLITVGEGRGGYRSAATLDRNEQGEAICVCGNFELREVTPAELEGVCRAVVIGVEQGWIARSYTILGHRDNPAHPNATTCPGRYLYDDLKFIKPRVEELLGGAAPSPTPPPSPTPTPGGTVLLYKVVSGDSYWKICEKVFEDGKANNTRVAQLQSANGNKALQPGDIINIPGRVAA